MASKLTKEMEVESTGRRLVHAAIKRRVADGSVIGKPWELIDAIDEAIRNERERAVRIIEDHRSQDVCKDNCWATIKAAIRKDD